MSIQKYNVNDKVISLENLSLWDNPYHYDKFEHSFCKTVLSANENFFSTILNNEKLLKAQNGFQKYGLHSQESGKSCEWYNYDTTLYHLEKDKTLIQKYFRNLINTELEKNKIAEEAEISKLQNEIARLQSRIISIKENGLKTTRNNSQRKFLRERILFIEKTIDLELTDPFPINETQPQKVQRPPKTKFLNP